MSGKEKRKFTRLKAHHLLKYRPIGGKKELSFVRNINAGGLLFHIQKEIALGSFVELDINLPSYPQPVKAVAKVTRIKPLKKIGGFDIAVEFVSIDERARDFINKRILNVGRK